jgi:hypothetical protein
VKKSKFVETTADRIGVLTELSMKLLVLKMVFGGSLPTILVPIPVAEYMIYVVEKEQTDHLAILL